MIYYIYADDRKEFIETCQVYLEKQEIVYLPFSKLAELDVSNVTHMIATGCLNEIKLLMGIAHQNDISLGIIPTSEQKELVRTFSLSTKIDEAVNLALDVSEKKIDLL
jgi:mevalonate kinase